MKRNKIIALCGAALLTLAIAGCSQPSSQAEYIGIDAAKAIALENAGAVSYTHLALNNSFASAKRGSGT